LDSWCSKDGYEVNEGASDDDEMQAEAMSFFLSLKALFLLNFRPKNMRKLFLFGRAVSQK